MAEDYKPRVIACGVHEGDAVPLLVDADGRLIYTGSDWVEWTPTLTWIGATPSLVGSSLWKYKTMGKIAFFYGKIGCVATGGETSLNISLPVAGHANALNVPFTTVVNEQVPVSQRFNTLAYLGAVAGVNNVIYFYDFPTMVAGGIYGVRISGFYDLA